MILIADAFNLLNERDPTWYDVCSESSFGSPNPNFGQPVFGCADRLNAFQTPRAIRLGARFEW